MRNIFLLLIFLSNLSFSIHPKAGTSAAAFLKIAPSARSVGMGEAFIAVSDDATSIYWNPAGLGLINTKTISITLLEWLLDIRYNFLGYVYPFGKLGNFGIGILGLYMDPMIKTLETTENIGIFTAWDRAIIVSYGKKIKGIYLGITTKYVTQKLEEKYASGIFFDFGILYKMLFAEKILQIGFTSSNIGFIKEFISEKQIPPIKYTLGMMYNLHKDENNDIKIALDYVSPIDNYSRIHLGTEYWWHNLIALRLGYKFGKDYNLGNLSFGIGFKWFGNKNIYQLNYAFVNFSEIDQIHRISFDIIF